MLPDDTLSAISMQRSTSFSTYLTNLTDADDKDPNFASFTIAGSADDLVSTTTFETRDDRPCTGCMSAVVNDVTDGWYQLEHNVKSRSDIHNCKAPGFEMPSMPSCNTDAYNCGSDIKTQTATLWIGSSKLSCTVPVCPAENSYMCDARTIRRTVCQPNLMDRYEYDEDDIMSTHSLSYSNEWVGVAPRKNHSSLNHSGHSGLGRRSFSLAKSLGKKVSKPSMKMIKPISKPMKLGRKDKGKSHQNINDAEKPSFIHTKATEVKESINMAGSKIESKLKEEQKAILSSIDHGTAKVSTSIKLAADATSLVTSHATNKLCSYQQKIVDEHTAALQSHTNSISQRLLAVEQKLIEANDFLNSSHQQILDEANGVVTEGAVEIDQSGKALQATSNDELRGGEPNSAETEVHAHSCTVVDKSQDEIEVVDEDQSMCPSNFNHSTHSNALSGSSASSCSIESCKYDNRMVGGDGMREDFDGDSFNIEMKLSTNGFVEDRCHSPIDVQTEVALNAALDRYHIYDEASQQEFSLSFGEV